MFIGFNFLIYEYVEIIRVKKNYLRLNEEYYKED